MEYRQFGQTELRVSVVGFGAWAIGGPAQVGDMAIGWGPTNDAESVGSIERAIELGINFFDTADFYGLGHSETLLGRIIGNRSDVVIASKTGQKIGDNGGVGVDYSKKHILQTCEDSLRRLRRDAIDFHHLHVARMQHLEQGECIEAMEQLVQEGKVRYWGISLNTFAPEPEADFFFQHQIGHGFQLVFNVINQRAVGVIERARNAGYGVIARMPLQFGLLSGKFTPQTTFHPEDHRAKRLRPEVLERALSDLQPFAEMAHHKGITQAQLALSFAAHYPGVTTIIPGIRTPHQAELNADAVVALNDEDMKALRSLYDEHLSDLMTFLETAG